jgi:hypothetical protein
MSVHPVPADPDIDQWLTPERQAQAHQLFGPAADLLAETGVLRGALRGWLERELVSESPWRADDDWLARTQEWAELRAQQPDAVREGLPAERLLARKLRKPAMQAWARSHWGHRLETLFLARKPELDHAACRILRVQSQALALELYHRIHSDGEDFASVAQRFGQASGDGVLPLQPLANLPEGLAAILQRMQPGELSTPVPVGKQQALVQLDAWQPASLDDAVADQLLQQELTSWCDAVLDRLVAPLT